MTREELEKEAEEYAIKQWEGNIPWGVIQKAYYDSAEPREKRIAELEKENAELKEQLRLAKEMPYSAVKKFAEEKTQEQLTKAKDIIKKFSELVNNDIEYDPEHPQEHTDLWNKLCEEAEQFLKE